MRAEADRLQGTLTLRVPAERFEAFAALKPLGKLRSESVAVQDVTRAYMDLKTRLRVKRDTDARLRDILRTRTAKLMEGERRYYDQQVALSTIVVALREPESALRAGALEPVREALRDSLRVFATSVAAIVYATVAVLPWLIMLGALAVVVRALRRRTRPTSGGTRGGPA